MNQIDQQLRENIAKRRQRQKAYHRSRFIIDQHKKQEKKKVFGSYYNYNTIKLNPQKRFRIEEVRNTEIERENRILLEKIQGIFKRSNIRSQHHYIAGSDKSLPKRRLSTEIIPKINKTELDYCLPKLRMETETAAEKKQANKTIIFKGRKVISDHKCFVVIFTDATKYSFVVERDKIQEKIQIPLKEYKFMEKYSLNDDPIRIFRYIQITDQGYLQLKGIHQRSTEVIEHGELSLPDVTINKQ